MPCRLLFAGFAPPSPLGAPSLRHATPARDQEVKTNDCLRIALGGAPRAYHSLDVGVGGLGGDSELPGDLLRSQAASEQGQDFALALGETRGTRSHGAVNCLSGRFEHCPHRVAV